MFGFKLKFTPILVLALLFIMVNIAFSQEDAKKRTVKKPTNIKSDVPEVPLVDAAITFDHTEFDFGEVPSGSKVMHAFPVENRGVDTLIITKIKAG